MSNQGYQKNCLQRPNKTLKTPNTPFSLGIAAIPREAAPFGTELSKLSARGF